MRFQIKNNSNENIINAMRKLGYHFTRKDEATGQLAFARILGGSGYPRFHIYLQEGNAIDEVIINLHLDQKKPIYKGTTAHSGEYQGELVEQEATRLKQFFEK